MIKKEFIIIQTILFLNLFCIISFAQQSDNTISTLPSKIDGWEAQVEDRYFDNETLFSYIDGAAEMFLSFGFTKVFNRIYTRDNQPDIIVDIFFMNSSHDAYGVFTHSVGKLEKEFGQQSQRTEGAIIFWKNNFYVSITSNPETEQSKGTIEHIAKIIDNKISEIGDLPKVLSFLPKKNLREESIRYFRHYNWQNSHTFISNENILNITNSTHGVLAQYENGNEKGILLLLMYPGESESKNALNNFIENYQYKFTPGITTQLKRKFWYNITSKKNFVIGVFEATSKEFAEEIILDVERITNR